MRKHPLWDLYPPSQGFVGSFHSDLLAPPALDLSQASVLPGTLLWSDVFLICANNIPYHISKSKTVSRLPLFHPEPAQSRKANPPVLSVLSALSQILLTDVSRLKIDLLWNFYYVDILLTSVLCFLKSYNCQEWRPSVNFLQCQPFI